jgi:hypothetical protein
MKPENVLKIILYLEETLQAFGALFQIPHYYRKFLYCKPKISCPLIIIKIKKKLSDNQCLKVSTFAVMIVAVYKPPVLSSLVLSHCYECLKNQFQQ